MPLITIVAPASPAPIEKKEQIITFLNSLGFDVQFAPHAFDSTRFLAGTDLDRANDLNAALTDPQTDIVMALRGGYGSPRILDKLDYKHIAQFKKPFFGFSDMTALQLALYKMCGMISFTGFNADCATREMGDALIETLKACINKESLVFENLETLVPGIAKGPVIGGTLTLLTGLMGTPYMPSLQDAILVIEEVHESPYRIDRMLNQLRLGGHLSQLQGIVLADCADCVATDTADGSLTDVFQDYFGSKKIPVVSGFPYGHTPNHVVFPVGQTAILNANDGTLTFEPFK